LDAGRKYCKRCERVRTQLRRKVDVNGVERLKHLRDAFKKLGPDASDDRVVSMASEMTRAPPRSRPGMPDRREPAQPKLAACRSNAPPAAAPTASQHTQTVLDQPLSGTNIPTCLDMGNPPGSQFADQAPSYPASRATSAVARVRRSRPAPASVRQVAGGNETVGNAARDNDLTAQKECNCCKRVCL
jgi:hypothetical protein